MTNWRKIYIYIIGVTLFSLIGGFVLSVGQPIGGLIFVTSPILMASLLRLIAKDGWRTAGLRLNLRGNLKVYLIAVAAFPLIAALTLLFGLIIGATTMDAEFWQSYLVSFAIMAPSTFLFAACEEFGWRGYLDPQLHELGVARLQRHFFVGIVWVVWHIPYIIGIGNYTTLPLVIFAPLFLVAMMAMTVWYGEMRQRTGSVWPAVIAHGIVSSVIWPLNNSDNLQIDMPLVFDVRPDAFLVCGLLIVVAVGFWLRGPEPPEDDVQTNPSRT